MIGRLRVLIVVHGFPPHAQGGAEIYADAQARRLAAGGDAVLVVTREADPARPDRDVRIESRNGLRIAWLNQTFRDVRRFEDAYADERVSAALAPVIDAFQPDVAHVHHLTCLSTTIVPWLTARGVPIVGTLHDYWLLCHRGQLIDRQWQVCAGPGAGGCGNCVGAEAAAGRSWARAARDIARAVPMTDRIGRSIVEALGDRDAARHLSRERLAHMRGVMAAVDRWLAPSAFMRDTFLAADVPADRIVLWPYGVAGREERASADAVGPSRPPLRADGPRPTGANGPLRVGFLGSLMVSKAPHLLLDAALQLPPGSIAVDLAGALVDYHGDAAYRRALAPRLRGPNVLHRGPLAHQDVPAWLAGIDVLSVPSIWPENSPLVIREAFANGVPVVASCIGGIPETVEHGRGGWLVDPGDATALATALSRLADDRSQLDALRRTIPPVRSIDDDVAATRDLYRSLVDHKRPIRAATSSRAIRPRLAAVVLNYRTPDDTRLAVRSLLASTRVPDDVIVIDNDESRDCERALAGVLDRIEYVHAGANLGFAGGMNAGIRRALARGADRVFLMNSDVLVAPDCLAALEGAIGRTSGAGIAGPLVVARAHPDCVTSRGLSYRAATGRMRHRGAGTSAAHAGDNVETVDAVSGCAMLLTREVIDRAGVFDEAFFFAFEDIDLCLRARQAGFGVALAAGARVFHEGGRAIGPRSPRRLYYAARNHLRVAARPDAPGGRLAVPARALFVVALNAAHAVRAPGGSLTARLAAVARGTLDAARGRWGEDGSAGSSGSAGSAGSSGSSGSSGSLGS